MTAARETLGWEPTVGLEEGLRLTADAPWLSPIRVLRLIARLNMGGPVAARLVPDEGARGARLRDDARRRHDRRAARARCRSSPTSSASRCYPIPQLAPRHLAALRHAVGDERRAPDPARAAAHPAHAHGEGGRDRPLRRAARRRRAAADRRPHLPRPRPARLLRPGAHGGVQDDRAAARALDDAPRRGQPGGARRPRRVRRGAAASGSASIRLGIPLDSRITGDRREPRAAARRCSACRTTASSSAGSAA